MSDSQQKKILFFVPYGQWGIHNQVDAILAKTLELRGCQALVVLCDGLYSDCALLRGLDSRSSQLTCQACARSSQQLFTSFRIPYIQLRQFIQDRDRETTEEWMRSIDPNHYADAIYKGNPIGQWVTSSIYTHFRITAKGLNRPDVRSTHRKYLIDSVITYEAFQRIIDWYRPDRLVLFNGRFAPYRIAFEVGRLNNLEATTHERGFIDDSFSFRQNAICLSTKPIFKYVKTWQATPINLSELNTVKEYFGNRERGKNTNWNPFYTYQTEYTEARRHLRIPQGAKIFSIFTSSEDELALSEDHAGLANQLEILQRFIEIFENRDEYLVIRHHPHIGGAGNNKAETDFIARAYEKALTLPRNVRFVMPSERLTAYALLWNTDAAISFFSTVSIEAASRGIPTAAFSNSPYSQAVPHVLDRNRLDIDSLRELVDRLFSSSLQIEDFRKLYRFTYTYFFRFSQKFKSFGITNRHYADIRIKSFEDLNPGIDPTLDRICNHILDGTLLYEMPPAVAERLSLNDEDAFLKTEIQRVHKQRNAIQLNCISWKETPIGVIHIKASQNWKADPHQPEWQNCSRHRSLAPYVFETANENTYEDLKDLVDFLDRIQEDYILIAHEGIQYDESFVSSAIDRLIDDREEEWDGVWSGGWIQSPREEIQQQIFTSSLPKISYPQAIQILPELRNPFIFLSFSLMRRTVMVQALQSTCSVKANSPVSERLFQQFDKLNIYKTGLPMLVAHQAKLHKTFVDARDSIDLSSYYEQIKKQPTSSKLYRQVGNILNEQGKLDAAQKAYQYAERFRMKQV
ncbi:MAG: hypothetical protein J7642_16420 [Cyanobacteria bacterium SBC]|nr:hypothetical protein [Cyanobacteria bacterium SBC]